MHEAFAANYFAGFIETVPAYSSLAVFYDPVVIRTVHPAAVSAFNQVKDHTEALIAGLVPSVKSAEENIITIPVYYNGEDLPYISGLHNISVDELVAIHVQPIYRVFMIGFQPGFAYMGSLDERIITPRKASPRIRVPAGAVGIAGSQTGIYPFVSPGGWQIIGQTPIKIFDKEKTNPCLFNAGDTVQFTAISKDEFDKLNEY